MSTFRDKPASIDILANSQGDIQGNFEFLQSVLNKDHQIVFNDTNATAGEGRHRNVGLLDGGANPAFPGDNTTAYLWAHNGDLFIKNAASPIPIPLTKLNFTFAATNGYTFLPGGFIAIWGKVTGATTQASTSITFATILGVANPFSTDCFSVLLCPVNASANSANTTVYLVSINGFAGFNYFINTNSTPSTTSFSFIAIGR